MYEIDGNYELTDYQRANRLHGRKRSVQIIFVSAAILVLLAMLILIYTIAPFELGGLFWVVALLFVLVIVLLCVYLVYLPYKIKKVFGQQKELSLPFHMKFDLDGIYFQNEVGSSNRPWTLFIKWKEDQYIMMLYLSDVVFVMLPKRLITNEGLDFIRGQLKANNIPNK